MYQPGLGAQAIVAQPQANATEMKDKECKMYKLIVTVNVNVNKHKYIVISCCWVPKTERRQEETLLWKYELYLVMLIHLKKITKVLNIKPFTST